MDRMRLAWFSPMPPVRSGIATCSAELVGALAAEHQVDVYVDAASDPASAGAAAARAQLEDRRVSSAHDFVWRHRRQPYDLTVFQLGNSSHHDYLWPYLFRYPGLAVLHDAHLHHARAAALLRTRRADDYRVEFAASHPEAPADAAELAVAGFDSHLYYSYPMTRLVVQASRMSAVHTRGMADSLRAALPGAAVETIRLGHGTLVGPEEAAAARRRVRETRGIPADAVVFGIFGGLTPDKRIPQVLDALAQVLAYVPSAHLLLAGAPARHYDVEADVRARGLGAHVTITGYIETDEELTAHVAACDVSLNLRWPTAREVSGPWLRALAAGCPTVIIDLAHMTDVPSLDPRTWRVQEAAAFGERTAEGGERAAESGARTAESGARTAESGERTAESGERRAESDPVTVAIDIVDEDHSLRLAMRRLATDAELRARLGSAGQRYWRREHSLAAMLEDYRRVLAAGGGGTSAPRRSAGASSGRRRPAPAGTHGGCRARSGGARRPERSRVVGVDFEDYRQR